jgi:AcrR family transcriptional regulator
MVKPSSEKKRDDTRTRILEAADAVFVRRGIDGARMQEIADQARVNKALLHYYFQSKIGLARAVWIRIGSSFVPGVLQMLASDLPLDQKIDRFVDAYHTVLTRHPYLLVFAISESARRPEIAHDFYSTERRKVARRMIDKLREQIDERAKENKSRAVSAEQFLVTLVGSCLFPFAARAMLVEVIGLKPNEIHRFMERRRRDLPAFLKRALQ